MPLTGAYAGPRPLPGQDESDWWYSLNLKGFAPVSTAGFSTIGRRTAPVDLGLGDVLDLLDKAGELGFEA